MRASLTLLKLPGSLKDLEGSAGPQFTLGRLEPVLPSKSRHPPIVAITVGSAHLPQSETSGPGSHSGPSRRSSKSLDDTAMIVISVAVAFRISSL